MRLKVELTTEYGEAISSFAVSGLTYKHMSALTNWTMKDSFRTMPPAPASFMRYLNRLAGDGMRRGGDTDGVQTP